MAETNRRRVRRDPLAGFFPKQDPPDMGGVQGIKFIDVALIDPNPYRLRGALDPIALKALADSIRQFGILQPLVVRKVDERYQLVVGERRWRAASLANLRNVPCWERVVADQDMRTIYLLENTHRTDLDAREAAGKPRRLIDQFGASLPGGAAQRPGSIELVSGRAHPATGWETGSSSSAAASTRPITAATSGEQIAASVPETGPGASGRRQPDAEHRERILAQIEDVLGAVHDLLSWLRDGR